MATKDAQKGGPNRDRRDRYLAVLRTVAYNVFTDVDQYGWRHAGIKAPTLVATLVRQGESPRDVHKSIQAALENDHLVSWRDREGNLRYTPATTAGLQAVVCAIADRDDPDKELLGQVNAAQMEAPETLDLDGYWPGTGGGLR